MSAISVAQAPEPVAGSARISLPKGLRAAIKTTCIREWAWDQEEAHQLQNVSFTWTLPRDPAHPERDAWPEEVGRCQMYRLFEYGFSNALSILDDESEVLLEMGEAIINRNTGWLYKRLGDKLGWPEDPCVFLMEARLAPEWRGHGLGVWLVGKALMRVQRSSAFAVCYPWPLDDDPYEAQMSEVAREAGRHRLRRVWKQLGFRKWRDGYLVLGLQTKVLSESVAALTARLAEAERVGTSAPGPVKSRVERSVAANPVRERG